MPTATVVEDVEDVKTMSRHSVITDSVVPGSHTRMVFGFVDDVSAGIAIQKYYILVQRLHSIRSCYLYSLDPLYEGKFRFTIEMNRHVMNQILCSLSISYGYDQPEYVCKCIQIRALVIIIIISKIRVKKPIIKFKGKIINLNIINLYICYFL